MAKRSRPRIITKDRLDLEAFPEHVRVALAEVASAARQGVLAVSVACGLQVVAEMMAAEVEAICGPKGKHDADREAYRHGTERRLLPLGGALVGRSEEHTSELQSRGHLVCRLLLEKKKGPQIRRNHFKLMRYNEC